MTGKSGGTLQLTRKELGDAYRAWRLQALVVFFFLVGAGTGYFGGNDAGVILAVALAFLVPLVGLVFTQHTIVQKRESGELGVLLSLPFSRRSIVTGAYLGRAALILLALVALLVSTLVFGTVSGTVPESSSVLGAVLIASVLGVIFVSLAVGLSAAVRSSASVSVGAFGIYFLFAFQLWSFLPDAIRYLANGFSRPDGNPTWAHLFEQLSPFAATRNAFAETYPELVEVMPILGEFPADTPTYMEPWFGATVLVAWMVGPVLLGYLQFERSDL